MQLERQSIIDIMATSTKDEHKIEYALHGEEGTYWQSEDGAVGEGLSVYIHIDLDEVYTIKKLSFLPIQSMVNNGGIRSYEVYVSKDKSNMGAPVKMGELPSTSGSARPVQNVVLDQAVEGKYIKLHIKSGVGDRVGIETLGIDVDVKEESDTSLKEAKIQVKGISHTFDLELGQTKFEHKVPFVVEDNDVVFSVIPNAPKTQVVGPENIGHAYRYTLISDDKKTKTYDFVVIEEAQRGDKIEVKSITARGDECGDGKPEDIIDGNAETMHQLYTKGNDREDAALLMEFEAPQVVHSMEVRFRQDHRNGGVKAYEVWGGNDKEALIQYKTGKMDTPYALEKAPQIIHLGLEEAIRYVEFRPTDAYEVAALTEIAIYAEQPLATSTTLTKATYCIDGQEVEESVEVDYKINTYHIPLNPFEEGVPKLQVETWNTFAEVRFTQIDTTEGTVEVQVTSQDKAVVTTYHFQFKRREPSKNTKLKKVSYYGVALELEEGKTEYVAEIPQGLETVDVMVIPEDTHTQVSIGQEPVAVGQDVVLKRFVSVPIIDGEGQTEVEVIAEDRETTTTYSIRFQEVSDLEKVQTLQPVRPVDAEDLILELGNVEVVVDSAFPRIMFYKVDGEIAFVGQDIFTSAVAINGITYYPQSVTHRVVEEGQAVSYTLHINQVKEGVLVPFVEMDMCISLTTDGHSKNPKYSNNMKAVDRNIVNYKITDIREYDVEQKVDKIEFVGQRFITLAREEAAYGAIKSKSGHSGLEEVFGGVKDVVAYEIVQEHLTYPLIYTGKYAAAMANNSVTSVDKFTLIKEGVYNTLGFANGPFTYRFTEEAFEGNTKTEALLHTQIIFDVAQNDDESVDWQDAAILFREIMPLPRGCEFTKDQIWWIAMNFTSSTSNPFLRVLDNGKLLSNYYDGFGQMILNKGYQGEGHDDSHPDYAEAGIRQGGAEDFNFMSREGKAYNIRTAIHINATEYMLDAVNTKLENLQGEKLGELSHGWAWLDASYHVDQLKDLESGEMERRIDDLYNTLPELDLVYIDVYYRADYHSQKFAQLLHRHFDLATEFAGPFEGNQVFTHWGTDLYYPGSGLNSKIYRFLYNGFKDAFNPESLLKGMQMPGVASWRGVTNMFEAVEIFYNQNLPTKYMQYSPIMLMEEDKVTFENGTYVAREEGSINLYSKDGNLVAKMTEDVTRCKTSLFIPWNPITDEKIYYWNNDAGATIWTLPNSWAGQKEVYVYEITSNGRKYIESLPVVDNQVTLDYKSQVPYIIEDHREDTSGLPQHTEWGQGSIIKNPGFDSLEFGDGKGEWIKKSHGGNTDHIQMIRMEEDEFYDNKLQVTGKADAYIAQEIGGLKLGKTYTVSAWINTQRPVELGMMLGDKTYGVSISDNKIENKVVDHKYSGKHYQRMRFDVTIEDITEATVYIHLPEVREGGKALIDDVRVFEQPGTTERNQNGAIYFEDFENVDEGWGVFEYALNGGYSKVHMARKDPEGRQIKSYAFDGEWSLKISDNKEGEVIRTYPSHVEFQPNTTYTVAFEYTLFAETKGETLLAEEKYPYTLSAKDEEGNTLEEVTLGISKLGTGEYGGNANHDPSVEKATITFTTPDTQGCYIAVSTPKGMPSGGGGFTSTALNILMIDNFGVYSEGHQVRTIERPHY